MPVANRPLLGHALTAIRSAGIREVVVVADSRARAQVQEVLREVVPADVDVTHVDAPRSRGELAALQLAHRETGDVPLVVHRGDALVGDLLARELPRFLDGGADAAELFLDPRYSNGSNEAHAISRGIKSTSEPLGIELLSPGIVDALDALADEGTRATSLLGGPGRPKGWQIESRLVDRGWRIGDELETVLDGNRFVLDDLASDWHPDSLLRSRVEGRVAIHPSSTIEDAVLRGPCLIGPDVTVRDAYIGPYTSIGAGSVVENVEVEHSVIMRNAVIRDVGWRLEHSLVGAHARVSRQFRLPQAIQLFIGDGARITVS